MRLANVTQAGQGAQDPPPPAGPAPPFPSPLVGQLLQHLARGVVERGPGKEGPASPQPCLLLPSLPFQDGYPQFKEDGSYPTRKGLKALGPSEIMGPLGGTGPGPDEAVCSPITSLEIVLNSASQV